MVQTKNDALFLLRSRKYEHVGTAFAVLTAASYLVQFFNRILGGYASYRIVITFALILLLYSKGKFVFTKAIGKAVYWLPFLFYMGCHVVKLFNISFAMDFYTYFICIMFIAAAGNEPAIFQKALKIVIAFALFYAASVWVQLLLPSVYNIYLSLLQPDIAFKIKGFRSSGGSLTGFTTNPGFAAGHMISGLIAFIALYLSKRLKKKAIHIAEVVLMFSGLIMTGKRGPLLSFVFASLVCYLLISDKKKRFWVINVMLFSVVFIIPLLFIFSGPLSSIPVFARVMETINGIMNGEDITNGRSKLYAYAVQKFIENPIFGIGWGQFKVMVVGAVTFETELDVHNIYLQLLCETGIVGAVAAITPMIVFLVMTIKLVLKSRKLNIPLFSADKQVLLYSLGYQLFFLTYGITGNPFYDYNYTIMYFIALAISAVCSARFKMLGIDR